MAYVLMSKLKYLAMGVQEWMRVVKNRSLAVSKGLGKHIIIFLWGGAVATVQYDQKKIAKCLQKLPKNDFTRKMIYFDTFTKIA